MQQTSRAQIPDNIDGVPVRVEKMSQPRSESGSSY